MLCARHDPLRLRKQSPLCPALPPAHRCHLAMSLALRMLNGSPAERLLAPIANYIQAKGGRIHTRWGCRCGTLAGAVVWGTLAGGVV